MFPSPIGTRQLSSLSPDLVIRISERHLHHHLALFAMTCEFSNVRVIARAKAENKQYDWSTTRWTAPEDPLSPTWSDAEAAPAALSTRQLKGPLCPYTFSFDHYCHGRYCSRKLQPRVPEPHLTVARIPTSTVLQKTGSLRTSSREYCG